MKIKISNVRTAEINHDKICSLLDETLILDMDHLDVKSIKTSLITFLTDEKIDTWKVKTVKSGVPVKVGGRL